MPGDRKLQILATAHLNLGVITSVLASVELRTLFVLKHILSVPFFASAFCLSFLLSLWGTVFQIMLWKRLVGLIVGVLYLEALVPGEFGREFTGIWTITVLVSAASLLVLRRFGFEVKGGRPRSLHASRCQGAEIQQQADRGRAARLEPKGPRLSIRGIMIFTAAIALLCAGARVLLGAPPVLGLLLDKLAWAMCCVGVGLFSLWAALEDDHRLRRSPAEAVFALLPALGLGFLLAMPHTMAGRVYILLTMMLYLMVLMASLLIVRSCGYRLARRTSSE